MMAALQLFIKRTKLGKAMRATAQDRDAAQLMGIDINTTIAMTFLIGSALAGTAGFVSGVYYGTTWFFNGFEAGLKAFTAAVLGGIGNVAGAMRCAVDQRRRLQRVGARADFPPVRIAWGIAPRKSLSFGRLAARR
jgi:branched-subunit amino acid ABC-type transport system permease component